MAFKNLLPVTITAVWNASYDLRSFAYRKLFKSPLTRLEHSVANTKRGKETIVSVLCDFLVARVVPLRKFFTSRIKSNKYLCFNELREGTENGVCRAFEAGLNSFFDPLHMKLSIAAKQLPYQGLGGGHPN